MNKIFNNLESIRKKRGCISLALIDPDVKNDTSLNSMIDIICSSDFDAILLGGSIIMDNQFEKRAEIIKNLTKIPVIVFPGSSHQITKYADAILYISLLGLSVSEIFSYDWIIFLNFLIRLFDSTIVESDQFKGCL